MKKALVFSMFFVFLAVGMASADTVSTVNNPLYNTTAITGFATSGDMMDGMSVTAYFFGGGSQTVLWADTGAGSGGVTGTGWSLVQSGDTFSNPWTLSASSALLGIFMDAKPLTVFDQITDPETTPGSARGGAFVRTGTIDNSFDVNATYAGPLGVGGNAPLGDLYTTLDLAFVGAAGTAFNGFVGDMTFTADTDNATTTIVTAPEPLSLMLIGFGLLGLAGVRRSIRK